MKDIFQYTGNLANQVGFINYSHVPNCRGHNKQGKDRVLCCKINTIERRDHNKRGGLV